MANDVHIQITADKPNTTGIKDTNRELGGLKDKAKETTPVIDGLTKSIGNSGKEFTATQRQLKSLDDSIAISKDKLESLARSFADTNDSAQKIDISKAMAKVQKDINDATKSKKLIIETEPKIDKNKFIGSLSSLGDVAGSHLGITLGGAAAVALLPVLAGAAAAAVLGAAGAGGIVGGIMLAKDDPIIKQAATHLGNNFKDELNRSAVGTFQKPILDSFKVLESGSKTAAVSIGLIFKNVAPYIRPLAEDINMAANAILGSLADASGKAGPVLLALGGTIVTVADGFSQFVNILSDGGPQAASTLNMIAGATKDVMVQTANFLNVINKASSNPWLTGPIFQLLRKHFDSAAQGSKNLGDVTNTMAVAMTDAQRAAQGEEAAMDELAKQLKGQTDPVFALLNAQRKLASAHKAAAAEAKKNGTNTDAYRFQSQNAAEAALDLESAVGKLGGSFDGKLSPSLRASLEAAKLNKNEINSLERQFRSAKGAGNDFAKTYAAKALLNGVPGAKSAISSLQQSLNNMRKNYTVTIHTVLSNGNMHVSGPGGSGTQVKYAHGGIRGSADGATPSGLTWVGENGPELRSIQPGTRIWSAGDSARMASRAGADSSPMQIIIRPAPGANADLINAIVTSLRFDIARKGSGSAQKHLGQPGRT